MRNSKITWSLLAFGGAAALLLLLFKLYFAPQPTTQVNQAFDESAGAVIKRGQFVGHDAAHEASGTVSLVRSERGYSLRFEGYDATSGPDVFFFLSKSPDGDFGEPQKQRVLVPNGAGEGQATLRGSFQVPLDPRLEVEQYRSVITWCVRFSQRFGWAVLNSAN